MRPHKEHEDWQTSENGGRWADLTSSQLTNRIVAVLIIVALVMAMLQMIRQRMTFDEALNSLSMELFGAAVTFYALELVVRPRKRRESDKARKVQLIQDMGSVVNSVALRAVEELRSEGWLQDGSLKEAILTSANLEGASLWGANLEKVNLSGANLRGSNLALVRLLDADLSGANLEDAVLKGANLESAILKRAVLKDAVLSNAKLQDADLQDADLMGVDLYGANLRQANLSYANLARTELFEAIFEGGSLRYANLLDARSINEAQFDTTILPNGDKWQADYALIRFTDPDHEEFWEKDWSEETIPPPWYKPK